MSGSAVETFRTHANYIHAIATLARGTAFSFKGEGEQLRDLAVKVQNLKSFSDQRKNSIDEAQVKRSLSNAWGSELLLGLAGAYKFEEELVRLSNNWAVVQCYYATYHLTQAYTVAKGGPRPDSHPKTQNEFMTQWVNRGMQLAPWTLGLSHQGYLNLPHGRAIDEKCSPWIECNELTALDLYAKALRTTREDHVSDALAEARDDKRRRKRKSWLDEEQRRIADRSRPRKEPSWPRPNLTANERLAVESRVRTHGLIDYLYRLRIKTNYVDSSMFIDGPEDDLASNRVHRDLKFISASTALLIELHLNRVLPRGMLLSWVDTWVAANMPAGLSLGVACRREILAQVT